MTEFSKTIKSSRKEKGLTLEELSNKLGVDRSYLSKLENDRVPSPSKDLIKRMSEVLLLDFESLSLLAGRISKDFVEDLDLKKVELFRSMKGQQYSETEYKKILKQIRKK